MEPHRHDENGDVILIEDTTPSPAEVEASAVTHAAEAQASAEIEVARVNADAAVQLAKIQRSTLEDDERIELEALRVEVAAMRQMAAPPEVEADPEPMPVIIDQENTEPEMAPPEQKSGGAPDEEKQKKSSHGMSKGWFG